jgi:flagellar assembly protein FliH
MSSKVVKSGASDAPEMLWRAADHVMDAAAHPSSPSAGLARPTGPDEHADLVELRKQLQLCQQQVEARAQDAHQKGIQQGLQQGEANVRRQFAAQQEELLLRLARTIEEISGMRRRCRYAAEQDVVKLALAIARRILHRELTVDPSAIFGLVKAALSSLDVRELHRVRIHPAQAAPVRLQLETMGLPQRCEVVGDPSLETGAAILETNHGTLDVSTETQLQEIERGFSDLVRQAK